MRHLASKVDNLIQSIDDFVLMLVPGHPEEGLKLPQAPRFPDARQVRLLAADALVEYGRHLGDSESFDGRNAKDPQANHPYRRTMLSEGWRAASSGGFAFEDGPRHDLLHRTHRHTLLLCRDRCTYSAVETARPRLPPARQAAR